jgi:hypothetical protein
MMHPLSTGRVLFAVGLAAALSCTSTQADLIVDGGAATGGTTVGGAGGVGNEGGGGGSTTTTTTDTGGSAGVGGAAGGVGGAGGAGGVGGGGGQGGTGGDPGDADADGDGWTPNQGDCCDTPAGCVDPASVNPGAFEYPGNGIDDDCDPATPDDQAPADCSAPALATPTTSDTLLRAMDLCQVTTEDPPLAQKKWGVISTALRLADQTTPLTVANNVQAGVLAQYGPFVLPKRGTSMAALSSGTARAPGDPSYVHPQNGSQVGQIGNYDAGTQVAAPASLLAPHGGVFPSPANCPACSGNACNQAYDSATLWARIRVPTNAKSCSYQVKFYSAEFPEYLCQQYNDFFVTLLQSAWVPDPNADPPEVALPLDGNIAVDSLGGQLSVNNGFFQVCFPPYGSPPGTCPSGTLELVGTGMGGWGTSLTDGGGTEWLTNSAPVLPGETIEIEFMIWDAGDHNVDSLVLLDKFRWSLTPSPVGLSK